MEKRDTRTLNQDTQAEIRRKAVKLLTQGRSQREVCETFEVNRTTVSRWWKRYQQAGWTALRKRQRGRPEGSGRKLTGEQEREVIKLITDKRPDQLKMNFALWTRQAVQELIHTRYGVDYAPQSLSVLLARWGFTPQKPLKRAYEQRPEQVRQWMDQTYPSISRRARTEGAEIFWGDETAVLPEAYNRLGYAPRGRTPVVRQPAKRFHSSIISAINNQGKMNWMSLSQPLNADTFIEFLNRLIKHRKRKIFLIVDNLRVHHSKPVKAWLEKHKPRIELFYLPSYSPELNPDEYLNQTLNQDVAREGNPRDKADLDSRVNVALLLLQSQAERIRRCFLHPSALYAAACSIY